MKFRELRRTRWPLSEIGFGAWGIGGIQWLGATEQESLAALRRAIELGVNFIDTALAYGDGRSEQLIGQMLRETGSRSVYVATKVPPMNRTWPAQPGVGIAEVFPRDHMIRSTEESLRNLGCESIDLQQLHVWNPDWTDCEEWKRAFEDLKISGKAKAVGISITEHEPDSALDVVRTGLVDSVQVIYNIFDQSPEKRLFPLCIERGVGVIARVPLDEGSLTGAVTEDTRFDERDFRAFYFRGDRKKEVVERVDALRQALPVGAGPLPEVALRFCLSHAAVSTVIPGMRHPRHVEMNCEASVKGPLPETTLAVLRKHAWPRSFYC